MISLNQIELINLEIVLSTFSSLVAFPNKETFKAELIIEEIISKFKDFDLDAGNSLSSLNDILDKYTNEQLMIEYARLFVGPYQLIAPPYGSYYLEEGKLMGDSTMEVLNIYETAGLSINETFKDLPDHIVAEIEFLFYLIYNKRILTDNNDNVQLEIVDSLLVEFYTKYFRTWIPQFSERIVNHSEIEFFIVLGKLLIRITEKLGELFKISFDKN